MIVEVLLNCPLHGKCRIMWWAYFFFYFVGDWLERNGGYFEGLRDISRMF